MLFARVQIATKHKLGTHPNQPLRTLKWESLSIVPHSYRIPWADIFTLYIYDKHEQKNAGLDFLVGNEFMNRWIFCGGWLPINFLSAHFAKNVSWVAVVFWDKNLAKRI